MESIYVIFNGELIPESEAKLGINDLSIVRGYGIFDYFKTIENQPIFLDDNLARFYNSAQLMDLDVEYSKDQLKEQIKTLMLTNDIPNSGIKILLTGGYSSDGYSINKPNLIITQHAISRNIEVENNGLKLMLFNYHRPFSLAKSIDYVMGIQALKKAKENGADDVLYYQNELISECPRANFFLITEDNKLLTPDGDVLEGITRKKIIELAEGHYEVVKGNVSVNNILSAKEAFICSTTKNITPISEIVNYKKFNANNPITKHLQKMLEEIIYK